MEKISVVVPVYRPPIQNLKACLQSLANQDYENYEVILVNDGGSLDLDNFCREFCADFSRFKIINQENKGVSAARNAGLAIASGTYICFCDADDYVSSDFLSVMERCMSGVDLVICGVTGQRFPVISSTVDIEVFFALPQQYNKFQYTNFCWNKMFRGEIIKRGNIQFDESVGLGEDALFLADYFLHCHKIRTVAKELYHYVLCEQSGVYTYYPCFWNWEKRVIEWQFKRFHSSVLNAVEQQYMKYWSFCKIRQILNYYGRQEADETMRQKVFCELSQSEVYAYLDSYPWHKGNLFFRLSDIMQLMMWKVLGLKHSIYIKRHLRSFIIRR